MVCEEGLIVVCFYITHDYFWLLFFLRFLLEFKMGFVLKISFGMFLT